MIPSESARSFSLVLSTVFVGALLVRAARYVLFLNGYSFVIFLVSVLVLHELWWRRRRLPPGPLPIPLLGNMLQLATGQLDERLQKWRKEYGEMYTVWIGPIPMVMVCGFSEMRRYFVNQADLFSHRWRNHVTHTFMGGDYGVVQTDGPAWREQRRFALHLLRNFGVGRPDIEEAILKEASDLSEYLLDHGKEGVSMCTPLAVSVGNIINKLLFGHVFPQGSEVMDGLHGLLDAQSQLVVHPLMGLYIALPWTTHVPLLNRPWQQLIRQRDQLWQFLHEQIREHKDSYEEGRILSPDFTYAYMEELKRRESEGEPMGSFSEWQLTMLLLDLFFAGMETTVTTLKWAFLFMIRHPHIQRRVQEELDLVVGADAVVALTHRPRLTYTQACISEIQRMANILPINLLRTTGEDVEDGKYFFPKGTMVIPQISVLLGDERVFPDPLLFNPDRFLDDSGSLRRIPEFIPFSIGKRQCLGESLARAELFLIFANVLKQLRLDADGVPSTRRLLGLTVSPPAYRVFAATRNRDDNHNITSK